MYTRYLLCIQEQQHKKLTVWSWLLVHMATHEYQLFLACTGMSVGRRWDVGQPSLAQRTQEGWPTSHPLPTLIPMDATRIKALEWIWGNGWQAARLAFGFLNIWKWILGGFTCSVPPISTDEARLATSPNEEKKIKGLLVYIWNPLEINVHSMFHSQ